MFSVTPEPTASNPAYGPQARQPRADQQPSDGFATLVDGNSSAASDARPAQNTPQPSRRDPRDTGKADASPARNNDDAPAKTPAAANDTPPGAKETTRGSTASGDTSSGKVKASGDKTSGDDKPSDGDTDAAIIVPTAAAVTDAVAVIIPVATETVATPASSDNPSSAPAAIAASAVATAALAAAATTGDETGTAQTPAQATPGTAQATPGTAQTDAATELAAVASTEGDAPKVDGAKIIAANGTVAHAKTETVSAKPAEAAPIKDGKSHKQAADMSSPATATADQTAKPEGDTTTADGKPVQHDKAATGAEAGEPAGKPGASAGHHAQTATAPLQTSPSDPTLQPIPAMAQQPVQTHAANLTAVPVATAQPALADTPVPLNGLAADIALRAAGGNSRFEIRLDPAELGRIDVRLDVDKHGNVTSHLTVERPATLDMLRNDAPRLQQALEDAGLKTGDSGLQFSLRDQSSSGQQQNDNSSGRQSQRVVIADEDSVPAQIAGRSYGRMLGASGGVDIRI